jgi:hypothetical protein
MNRISLPTQVGLASLRYATDADMQPLAQRVEEQPETAMVGWHFIHIAADFEAEVDCLGWMYGDVYVTSRVRAYDPAAETIRTRSGRVYRLRSRGDDGDMERALARHLVTALFTWGYASQEDCR